MELPRTPKNPARIWTFDGGGPGVISQLIIINEIMLQIQWIRKLTEVPRPCEYADLMVGSAMGAIVVVLLARLRLTAEEALGHLVSLGQDVFIAPNESTNDYRFDVERLSKAIRGILKDCGLDESTKMIEDLPISGQTYAALTAVPASDLSACRLLRTYRVPGTNSECTIVDAVLATMAVPRWFPPAAIGRMYSSEELISGSVGFNNPTKKALEEATWVFGSECPVSVIISLGSGQQHIRSLTKQIVEGTQEVLRAMQREGDSVTNDLVHRFSGSSFYHRLSVDSGIDSVVMTGWSECETGAITSHTKSYMEPISPSLEALAKIMVENKASHTLGQLTQVKTNSTTAKSVPRVSPYYITREGVYDTMERCLVHDPGYDQRLFVIFGMGGVGKTQSAAFFARRNRNRYKYIFFIDASSVDSIKADLQSAIRSLGGAHSQDTFEDALLFLEQPDNRDCLVIFDNADDPELPLATYLPKCEHGTILITGRNHNLTQLAPTSNFHLQGMAESDSIQVLFKAARRDTDESEEGLDSATQLCRLLGGLPLTLVHAGCYCHTTQISFSKYLQRFKSHRSKMMESRPSLQRDEYSYSTYTSINLSYSLLDECARKLLHLLAFFHCSSICLDIFQVAAKYEFKEHLAWDFLPRDGEHSDALNALRKLLTPDGSWSDVHVDDLLHQLQNFSLISLSHSKEQTNVTLHPLVQSCIIDTISSEDHSLSFRMAAVVLSSCSRREEIALFQHFTGHIAEMEGRKMDIHPNEIAGFGYILYWTGNYQESLNRWEKARDACRSLKGEEDRSTLRMSYRIADCLRFLLKHQEAEAVIKGVAKIQESALGEDDEDTLESYRLLARILTGQHKTEEAENILKRILALHESKYSQEHARTFRIQSSLAYNLFIQERYSEAEAFSRIILPRIKKVLGEEDDITLGTLNTISLALTEQGKWEEAEGISRDLVTRGMRKYGKQHPDTLSSLRSLANCRFKRGDLDEAETMLREVLELQERSFGKDHQATISTRQLLEDVIQAQESLYSAKVQPQTVQNPPIPIDLRSTPDHSPPRANGDVATLEPIQKSETLPPPTIDLWKRIWKSLRRK